MKEGEKHTTFDVFVFELNWIKNVILIKGNGLSKLTFNVTIFHPIMIIVMNVLI